MHMLEPYGACYIAASQCTPTSLGDGVRQNGLHETLTFSCFDESVRGDACDSLIAFSCTVFTMPLALTPILREDKVSAALSKEGEQQMIRAVLAVPPSESCKRIRFSAPLNQKKSHLKGALRLGSRLHG